MSQVSPRKYKTREDAEKKRELFESAIAKRRGELEKRGWTFDEAGEPQAPAEKPSAFEQPAEPRVSREEAVQAKIAELEAKIAETHGKPEFTRVAAAARGQITKLRKSLPTSAPHAA